MSELSERIVEAVEAEIVNAPWSGGDINFDQAARGAAEVALRELESEFGDMSAGVDVAEDWDAGVAAGLGWAMNTAARLANEIKESS